MKEGDNQRDQVQVWASLTQGSCTPLKLRWTAAVKQSETIEHLPKVSAQPYPCPLGFLPNQLFLLSDVRSGSIAKAMLSLASLFPYSHPHPVGVLVELE